MGLMQELRENPIFEQEMRALRRDRRQRYAVWGVWALFAILFLLGLIYERVVAAQMAGVLFVLQAMVQLLGASSVGSASIVREKERQRWESLQMSLLEPHEIVLAKAIPAAIQAFLPILPAPALIFLLAAEGNARYPDQWPLGPLILTQIFLALYTLLWVALSLNVSATSGRSGEAIARTLLLGFLTASLPMSAAGFIFNGMDYSHHAGAYLVQVGILFATMAAATIAVLLVTAESLPGYSRVYTRPARLAGGATLLGVVTFITAFGLVDSAGEAAGIALGLHAAAVGFGAPLLCARMLPPAAGRRLSPFGIDGHGTLLYWGLLHAAALGAIALMWAAGMFSSAELNRWLAANGPATAFWGVGFSTALLLMTGAFGCLVAARLARVNPTARGALGALVPVALLGFTGLYAGAHGLSSSWRPVVDGLAETGVLRVLAWANPVHCLCELANEGPLGPYQAPGWDAVVGPPALAVQVLLGLLLLAASRRSSKS